MLSLWRFFIFDYVFTRSINSVTHSEFSLKIHWESVKMDLLSTPKFHVLGLEK